MHAKHIKEILEKVIGVGPEEQVLVMGAKAINEADLKVGLSRPFFSY